MTPNVLQKGLPTPFLSEEWWIAIAPEEAYTALVNDAAASPGLPARLGVIWLLFATIASVIVTGRITVGLVVAAALSWSFVLVLQALIGTLVIWSAPARRVPAVRALDLWFASHLPYSLWLLAMASWFFIVTTFPPFSLALTVVVPAAWTCVISRAYCRAVLGASARGARWGVAVHQTMAWLCVAAYLAFASGGPTSLIAYFSRQLGLGN